jgi:hypothetical protein
MFEWGTKTRLSSRFVLLRASQRLYCLRLQEIFMALFARKKESAVQSFLVSLLNENCRALRDCVDGPRMEKRVNLTLVLAVVPMERGKPAVRKTFYATTKEFSTCGVALVVDQPCGIDEALLGFRRKGSMVWIRAKARHLHPLGGGFFQLGFRLVERLESSEFEELETIPL